jgi:hypothetical protein
MSDGFEASPDVFAYLQRTGSRATIARRLDARLDQPDLRTVLGSPTTTDLVQYPIEVAADLAVAFWRFEEESGSVAAEAIDGLDGAYTGGITYRVTGALALNQPTDVNYAIGFDGATAEMRVTHDASINFGAGSNGSVEFWIKTTQAALAHVLGKYNAAGYPYAIVLQADGKLRFERYNGSTTTQVVSAGVVNDGDWHYVAATWDTGVQALLQIDDLPGVTTVDAGGATGNTSDLVVGHRSGADFFNGSVDELAIYGYALTGALMDRHYSAGTGVPV